MWREINLIDKTVYLNRDAMATIEDGDGHRALIRLMDGTEYQTNEDYEEFLEEFGLVLHAPLTGTKTGQK